MQKGNENLLIKNVNIVDFKSNFHGDLYIEDGIIKEVGREIKKKCNILEGNGLVLMPAFIDTHAHFRDPGFTHKEDIESGSKAAVKGGYSAVNLMANTNPVCSSKEVVDYVLNRANQIGLVDVHQCVSITKDLDGTTLDHLKDFKDCKYIKAISDDGKGVKDSKIMLDAMKIAKENDWVVMSHAESPEFTGVDMRLAENIMTWRDITLAKVSKCRLHMAHVSTKEAIEYIIQGKNDGIDLTCEVTPHHIALTNDISNYRVNPPIRDKEDASSLITAIQRGYVDCIGTDHAPHTYEDKKNNAPGMTGIELAFSICYTKLVKEEYISLSRLSEMMSAKPAEIIGFNKGKIQPGYDGDLVLIDLKKKEIVDSNKLISKGKNTPFEGNELYGKIMITIKNGEIVFEG